ncbi:MAG: alpha-glucosidase [Lachnospiraceae bacterium]|nr:alpha-glucosidase [Lachnospiraceae bacterium]
MEDRMENKNEMTRSRKEAADRADWWKSAVVYQIYPKSFQDSSGNGFGDIRGILSRLDYLTWLGVNVLWICPIYRSPMVDNGYDIADYYHVDPSFGTDEDLDELIREAEKRGMKILMDLVVNHTSDQHAWFQEALKDPEGPYGKYYIFRKGKDGKAPDNLRSYFGGSAWEPVGRGDLYYFHAFAKEQPDLNWENEAVREEISRMVNYWLDKGIGGFRIDAIGNIKKNLTRSYYEPDGEDGLAYAGAWIQNQPGIEDFLRELDEKTFRPHNSMTVAEVGVPAERLEDFIGENGFFRMVFDFSYTDIDVPETAEWYVPTGWTVKDFRNNLFRSQLDTRKVGWAAPYLENHDQPRSLNKYIPEEDIGYYSASMLGTLFLCLRGTPFIYQGQEIGMTNIRMDSLADYDDVASVDQYHRAVQHGISREEAMEALYRRSRDNGRIPMQWSGKRNAGFSENEKTWLKVNPNYLNINVEKEMEEPESVLHFYRKLIALRRESEYADTLVYGELVPICPEGGAESEDVIAYFREDAGRRLLVACNFGGKEQKLSLDAAVVNGADAALQMREKQMILDNYGKTRWEKDGILCLHPYECVICEL